MAKQGDLLRNTVTGEVVLLWTQSVVALIVITLEVEPILKPILPKDFDKWKMDADVETKEIKKTQEFKDAVKEIPFVEQY